MAPTSSWIPLATPADAPVVSLRVAGADLFALASTGSGSALLRKQGARFVPFAEHPAELLDLCVVPSGCLFGLGRELIACHDGTRWQEQPLPRTLARPRRIWECSTSELYALGEDGLFFFDGADWREASLPKPPEGVAWRDGDGCAGAGAWLVGSDGGRCLLAGGARLEWALGPDCPDPELSLVRVFARGDAVAVGERVWLLRSAGWEPCPAAPSVPGRRALFAERFRGDLVVGYLDPATRILELACSREHSSFAVPQADGEATPRAVCLLPTGYLVLVDAAGRAFQSRSPALCVND